MENEKLNELKKQIENSIEVLKREMSECEMKIANINGKIDSYIQILFVLEKKFLKEDKNNG